MKSSRTLFENPTLISCIVGTLAFVVYAMTVAPGLDFIDSGELATVATTLGIAHPTGYPLFTLVGHLFAHLPVGNEPIDRLNFMAALFCGAGIGVFVRLMEYLLAQFGRTPAYRSRNLIAAVCGGLLLAFSETYWSQATAIEVYSLHAVLVISVLYVFLRANESRASALWMFFAFLLGLCFTNHMTTILLAPGFLFYYFARQGSSRTSWVRILSMGPFFLLGLSMYLYLPIRAGQNPLMNWGNPESLERFFWHWSGQQYRVWIFSSTAVAGKQLSYFLDTIPSEFAYVGGVFALGGVVGLWRTNWKLGLWTTLLFIGCVAYSINYDIHDIDSYFLLAYIITALWAGWGAALVLHWLSSVRGVPTKVWYCMIVAISALPLIVLYPRENEHQNHLVEDYTNNMFASFDSNAIVLSYQWDYWVSAAYYDQLVRGMRQDVVVIDKELLRRSWYFHHIERRYPWLIARSRIEVDAFLHELEKFEHGRPYNGTIIEARYVALLHSLIEKNLPDHPIYVCPEIEGTYTSGYQRVPEGLAFRVFADTLFHPIGAPEFYYRALERTGRLEDQIKKMYADAFLSRGDYYFLRKGDREEAARAYRSALVFEPGAQLITGRLKALQTAQNAIIR